MKRILLFLLCAIVLIGCERPATSSDWSPINDAGTPLPADLTITEAAQLATEINYPSISTSQPQLDFDLLPNPLPESMKGYELVSWQVGEDWQFTLVTGTNRQKTFEELVAPQSEVNTDGYVKITVSGEDAIKFVLGLLPAGSQVYWGGMDLAGSVPEGTVYFTYPEAEVIEELIQFCAQNDVELVNLSEPQ